MMGNLNTCLSLRQKTKTRKTALREMGKDLEAIHQMFQSDRVRRCVLMMKRTTFIRFTEENCQDEAARQWLRENSESFSQLADMFLFLKKHIDEEEKKNHSNNISIVFVAHGSVRDSMIPASCLLPLPPITDLLLDSPWSCWSSVKEAGDQMVPNIELSPLQPPEDVHWEEFQSLLKTHGPAGRNHIIIPFILPGERSQSVPLFVVTLALSLVLLSSRFTATVHLSACLSKTSAGHKLNQEDVKQQFVCTVSHTGRLVSDMLSRNWMDVLKRFMVKHPPHVCL